MLRMAGLELHPAVKALVAAGLLAVGLTRHHGQGIALIGAVLLAWAAFDALSSVQRVGEGEDEG